MPISRRDFLSGGALTLGALTLPRTAKSQSPASPKRRFRAAIIGHTGGGDYGHGYDQVFKGLENVAVDAVADPDAEGARKAAERAGAQRTYADYRILLDKEKPELVAIAMRHPQRHMEIALAALNAGASLFMEKPITETLEDADAIVAAARRSGAKIVVAHNRRYAPEFARVRALLAEGFVGKVREVRVQGKQDARAGGEDMIVLGTHDFDLMRFCFGDPLWCSASVLQDGRAVTTQDIRQGQEPIRVAGDTIRAEFVFPGNVSVTWSSVKTGDAWNQPSGRKENWAFEILGSNRIIGYQSGPGLGYLDSPFLFQPDSAVMWKPLPEPSGSAVPDHQKHMARDLVHCVATGSRPLCSAEDGRWAIEMVSAVYQSHFEQRRIEFPLRNRRHPLG